MGVVALLALKWTCGAVWDTACGLGDALLYWLAAAVLFLAWCAVWGVLLSLGGCGALDDGAIGRTAAFRQAYAELEQAAPTVAPPAAEEKRISVSAAAMPLGAFVTYVARESGVSVVVAAELDRRPVTVEFRNVPVSEVLSAVARRFNMQVTRVGGTFYMGDLKPEDRGVLCRRIGRMTPQEARDMVATLLSEHGRASCLTDGVLVVGDKVAVLDNISKLLDQVEAAPADSWVVQALVVEHSVGDAVSAGVDVASSAQVAATFAGASGVALSKAGSLSGAFSANMSMLRGHVTCAPMVLVADGEAGSVASTEMIPVPQKTTSPEGTVTTTGFTNQSVGTSMAVTVRHVGEKVGRVKFLFTMGRLLNLTADGFPHYTEGKLDLTTNVASGGLYLMGSLASVERKKGVSGFGVVSGERNDSTFDVWLRVYCVGGSTVVAPPGVKGEKPLPPSPNFVHSLGTGLGVPNSISENLNFKP